MNEKQTIIEMLNKVPEHKLGYILAYIQGLVVEAAAPTPHYSSLEEREAAINNIKKRFKEMCEQYPGMSLSTIKTKLQKEGYHIHLIDWHDWRNFDHENGIPPIIKEEGV